MYLENAAASDDVNTTLYSFPSWNCLVISLQIRWLERWLTT